MPKQTQWAEQGRQMVREVESRKMAVLWDSGLYRATANELLQGNDMIKLDIISLPCAIEVDDTNLAVRAHE